MFSCCYFPHIIIHVLCFTLSIPLLDARVSHCKLELALYLIHFICNVLIYAVFLCWILMLFVAAVTQLNFHLVVYLMDDYLDIVLFFSTLS